MDKEASALEATQWRWVIFKEESRFHLFCNDNNIRVLRVSHQQMLQHTSSLHTTMNPPSTYGWGLLDLGSPSRLFSTEPWVARFMLHYCKSITCRLRKQCLVHSFSHSWVRAWHLSSFTPQIRPFRRHSLWSGVEPKLGWVPSKRSNMSYIHFHLLPFATRTFGDLRTGKQSSKEETQKEENFRIWIVRWTAISPDKNLIPPVILIFRYLLIRTQRSTSKITLSAVCPTLSPATWTASSNTASVARNTDDCCLTTDSLNFNRRLFLGMPRRISALLTVCRGYTSNIVLGADTKHCKSLNH